MDSTETQLDMHRLRLSLSSELGNNFGAQICFDAVQEEVLKDATIWYRPFSFLSLEMGKMKPGFGYNFQIAPRDLRFISRSKASDFIERIGDESRNYGVQISGDMPAGLRYAAGLYKSHNYIDGPFTATELFTAQLQWLRYQQLTAAASFRTESFRQHPLLQYRAFFYDFALQTNLLQNTLHATGELFIGDPSLIDYTIQRDTSSFVTLSLRCMLWYNYSFAKQCLAPVVSIEHIDNGFSTKQVYTGGIRWDIIPEVFVSLDGEMTYNTDSSKISDRKLLFQISYNYNRKIN